ncbi:hypothetical protein RCL1_005462 [Eukaryota sp. TZLM3-RCL]
MTDKLLMVNSEVSHLLGDESQTKGLQSGAVAIFSIVSTMLGSSVLAMPWGMQNSGFIYGWILAIIIGSVCFYTCTLLGRHTKRHSDFADVLTLIYGPFAGRIAHISSALVVIGASISYCCILSDDVASVYTAVLSFFKDEESITSIRKIVPVFLLVILIPLACLRKVDLLVSISSYGIISVCFVLFTVYFSSIKKGLDIVPGELIKPGPHVQNLAGLFMTAFFIHNLVTTIRSKQRFPQKMTRNLGIAYLIVGFCYVSVGSFGWLAYRKDGVILQNWLEILEHSDPIAIAARCLLIVQILVVYPILVHLIRQAMFGLFKVKYPTSFNSFFVSLLVVCIGTSFAIWYPQIGDVLRYIGGFSGMLYIFGFPCMVHITIKRRQKTCGFFTFVFHGGIICLGVVLFALQFFE